MTVVLSGRQADGGGHDGLVFDGRQASLATTSVTGPLGPGDDRDPELLSRMPSLPVQDVLVQQSEE